MKLKKEIYFPDDTLYYDDLSRSQYLRSTLEQSKLNAQKMLTQKIYNCNDHSWSTKDDFSFLPVSVASLFNSSQVVEYKDGTCFQSLKFSMQYLSSDSIKVTIEASNKKSTMWREALFVSTTSSK